MKVPVPVALLELVAPAAGATTAVRSACTSKAAGITCEGRTDTQRHTHMRANVPKGKGGGEGTLKIC